MKLAVLGCLRLEVGLLCTVLLARLYAISCSALISIHLAAEDNLVITGM